MSSITDTTKHREMFTLPPARESDERLPVAYTKPAEEVVTGDKEVDAVLWLHKIIQTGEPGAIERAMEAAKRIKTPLETLEKRYTEHLMRQHPGNPFAALSSIGFADLESMAERAIMRRNLQDEAGSRFGDNLLDETEAEQFCLRVLKGLEEDDFGFIDSNQAAERFKVERDLLPGSLDDCLYELKYWDKLYAMRNACEQYYDSLPETFARERFVFDLLAEIPPQSRQEARDVNQYVIDSQKDEKEDYRAIVWNLIG